MLIHLRRIRLVIGVCIVLSLCCVAFSGCSSIDRFGTEPNGDVPPHVDDNGKVRGGQI